MPVLHVWNASDVIVFKRSMNTGYAGRLGTFFRLWLPIDVDLRRLPTGAWLVGGIAGGLLVATVLVALVVATLGCLARRDRSTACAVAVLAFPFLFSAQPGTWFWEDGRYIVFLSPLLAIVLAAGIEALAGWPLLRARAHRRPALRAGLPSPRSGRVL